MKQQLLHLLACLVLLAGWTGCSSGDDESLPAPTAVRFGYDANGDGHFAIRHEKTGVTLSDNDFSDGIFTYDIQSSWRPDGFVADDKEDYWMGGWDESYPSYYFTDNAEQVPARLADSYSQLGANARNLTNHSWDAWTLSSINSAQTNIAPRPEFMTAAPATK